MRSPMIKTTMRLIPRTENKILGNLIKLAVIFWLIELGLILVTWAWLPPQLPFFYSKPWGGEQLVQPFSLFILPLLGLIVFFGNLTLMSFISRKELLIRHILIISIFIFNLLSLITLVQIIRLVL